MDERGQMRNFIFIAVIACIIVNSHASHDLGCFRELRSPVYFSLSSIPPGDLTPEKCMESCSGRSNEYAILRGGISCFCSDTSPSGTLNSENGFCTEACSGDNSQTCGGIMHVYVFAVKPQVRSTISVSPDVVSTGDTVSITTNISPPNSAFSQSLSFDESLEFSEFVTNGTGLESWNWYTAGTHTMTSQVTDDESIFPLTVTTQTVDVSSPVWNLTLDCPSFAVTYDPTEIDITVARGSGFHLDIQHTINSGWSPIETVHAADARESSLGNSVVPSTNESTVCTNGLVVHHSRPADFDGYLAGIEFYGLTGGSLNVYIYRPACPTSGDQYCPLTHACSAPIDCAASCGGDGYCSSKQDCCSITTSQSTTLLAGSTYSKIHTIAVTITQGHDYLDLTADGIEILKGDVLAHDATGTILIATKTSESLPWADYYCDTFVSPSTFNDGNCVITSEFHMLAGVYVEKSTTQYVITFTETGPSSILVVAENEPIGGAISESCSLNVTEGVDAANIIVAGVCLAKDENIQFQVGPHTGAPTTTSWDFGNSHNVDVSDPGSTTYAYPDIGVFVLTANISNPVSYKFNTTTVCVMERIKDLTIVTPGAAVVEKTSDLQCINLTVTSGSNYTCEYVLRHESGSVSTFALDELTLHYAFDQHGDYSITVNCSNFINWMSVTKNVRAVEPITGVALTPAGAKLNVDFRLQLSWETGTDVNLNYFTYDGNSLGLVIDSNNRLAESALMNESITRVIPVTYELENALNKVTEPAGVFSIETPITNAWLNCDFTNRVPMAESSLAVIPVGSSVSCSATMTNGTSVEIIGQWGDGPDSVQSASYGEPWNTSLPSFTLPVTHNYNVQGTHAMKFLVRNGFNELSVTYTVMVMKDVTGLSLQTLEDTKWFDPPAILDFYIVGFSPLSLPNNVTLEIQWGEGNTDIIVDIDLLQNLTHTYQDKDGDLVVSYTFSNLISSQSGTLPVHVVSPVKNMSCLMDPIAGLPTVPLDMVFKAYRAPPANVLSLTFVCDTSNPAASVTKLRQNNGPNGLDTHSCTYPTATSYEMSITAVSLLETKTCTHTFKVLTGVTNNFVFTTNAPIRYDDVSSCALSITITYNDAMPDDAQVYVDFGDGNNYTALFTNPTTPIAHTYANTGHYTTIVTIMNDASSETRSFNTGCYKYFGTTDFLVKYEPALPLGSLDQDGYLTSKDRFPVDGTIKLYTTLSRGTLAYWDITAESASKIITCTSTDVDIVSLTIDTPGQYTIDLAPVNPVQTGASARHVIYMLNPVSGIVISEYHTTNVNDTKIFNVDMEYFGTDMCVAADFGVASHAVVYTYGNSAACTDILSQTYGLEFTINKTVVPGPVLNVTESFNLTFVYNETGTFTLRLYAGNSISTATSDFTFAVSGLNCSKPRLSIIDQRSVFTKSREEKRSNRIKIIGITDMACRQTLDNFKNWRVFSVNDTTGEDIDELDVTGLSSHKHSEFAIPKQYLPYGLYRVLYRVTMNTETPGETGFYSEIHTFLKVTESPLSVQVTEYRNSFTTVGINEELEINAYQYSTDPDESTPNFDYFEMSCRCVTDDESFTDDNVDVFVAGIPTGHFHTGGCFGTGPGKLIGVDGGILRFHTSVFTADNTYEFKIVGYKQSRSSEFYYRVMALGTTPPRSEISLKIPSLFSQSQHGLRFNPSSQLGFVASVLDFDPSYTYFYAWQAFAYDFHYCELFDCWRPLDYLLQYIDGVHSEEFVIHKYIFDHYYDVNSFKIDLRATANFGGSNSTGLAYMFLERNSPPKHGNCIISPTFGYAAQTKFDIQCSNFSDDDVEDSVANYQIKCKSRGTDWVVLAEGVHAFWTDRYLPPGDPDNFNILNCSVTVTDDKGSFGEYDIGDITVEDLTLSEYLDWFKAESDIEQNEYDRVQAGANLDTTAQIATMVGLALYNFNSDSENEAYANVTTASSMRPTSFNSKPRNDPFQTDKLDEDAKKEYEDKRDTAAGVLEQLIETFDACTVESIDETKRLVEAMEIMTETVTTLTLTSQKNTVNLLQTALNNANNEFAEMTVEDAAALARSTMGICSDIIQAGNLNMEYSTNLDKKAQEQNAPYFDTSKKTSLEEIQYHDNDDDMMKDGLRSLQRQEQRIWSPGMVQKCSSMTDEWVNIIARKTVQSQTIDLDSANSKAKIMNTKTSDIAGTTVQIGDFAVDMPSCSADPDEKVVVAVQATPSPSGTWVSEGAVTQHSGQIKIQCYDLKGAAKRVVDAPPFTITIPQDEYKPEFSDSSLPYSDPFIREGDNFFYQKVDVQTAGSCVKMVYRPNHTDFWTQHLVFVTYKDKPKLTNGEWNVIKTCLIPSDTRYAGVYEDENGIDPYSCILDGYIVGENTGEYIFGIRELRYDELNNYDFLPVEIPGHWASTRDFNDNYKNWVEINSCGASEDGNTVVSTDGLRALQSSTSKQLVCQSSHLTTFGGGWAVAPNTIDWNFVFSNADFLKNPTLYVTQIVIILAYIVAMIWARRKDRQDVAKLGLAPLPCNDKHDKYYYEIMVSTGMRRGAGTKSKVHFILSGEEDETEVRTFADKKRQIFSRGSTDGFLMSVPSPLGALMYLRIWHDNSGKGRMASWYLNHVIVRDVQTEKKYYFIANRWFAVEEDDGQVDRVIPIAGKEQMTEFSHMFTEKATKNLSDGHLWFSVVARPPQSRFTRCQRVSCCLCLLYSSMLANAMFYGVETSDSSAFTFGPFALTSKQIFIGIICNVIVFPVNFLLIHLFRRARPRKLRPSRVEEALKSTTERSTSMADVNPRVKSSLDFERPGSSFLMDAKRSTSAMSRPESSMSSLKEKNKKKKKCELPWWFTIIAWILLWVVVLVCAAFVTFYGITFQDIKCKKWITSMLISFFTSVFLTQPIKVFLFAIIFSLIIKNPGGDEDEDDDEEAPKKIECDEEYLYDEEDEFGMISPRKPLYKPKPPNTKTLETARKQRLKEIQMWAVIREILFYAFFLWILLVISYRSVSNNSYNYKLNMEKVFILTNDTNKSFFKIKNTPDFWTWAQSGMLRGLRAGPYYNNFPPFYMRGYINDKVSRLMGPAVLRQVRIKPDTCTLPGYMEGVIKECNGLHSMNLEQKGNFAAGWAELQGNDSREEYTYRTASELDGYPYWGESAMYGGGGYIVNLDDDYFGMIAHLQQLEREGWIDQYTRAVFLEFTVYNPSINLFSISTLLAEFRPSGGVFPTYRFEPCNLLPYMNSGLLFQIACEIIYLAFTIFFLVTLFRNLVKQKSEYFTQFWNLVDLGICAMSVTAIVIYFYRLVCINELTEFFEETHGDGYAKFQYVGYWSEIFNYIIGFLVFFATLKFMKLLRFNKKISLLSDTLKNSSKDLLHFSVIFNVTFLAFIQFFYLVYMSHLDTFKTFIGSYEAGIVMMMGKFDIYNMLAVNQWLTQIFIFLFVVTITFIVVNMLLSILNDTFTAVRNDKNKRTNDYEIVDFMLSRFKMWTGIGRGSTTISPADLEKERKAKSLEEQVDQLPDQIDRFLASISNMYIGDAKFDSFLQKGMAQKMAMKARMHDPAPFHPAPVPRLPGSQRLSHGARGMTDVQTD